MGINYWHIPNESVEVILKTSANYGSLIELRYCDPSILDGWYLPEYGIEKIQYIIQSQL